MKFPALTKGLHLVKDGLPIGLTGELSSYDPSLDSIEIEEELTVALSVEVFTELSQTG